MIKTDKYIAAAYANAILELIKENPCAETTLTALKTVRFLLDNYDTKPKEGMSTGDTLLRNLQALEAAIVRTVKMNAVLDTDDAYLRNILGRFEGA